MNGGNALCGLTPGLMNVVTTMVKGAGGLLLGTNFLAKNIFKIVNNNFLYNYLVCQTHQ